MKKKIFKTPLGNIQYWINIVNEDAPTLVFLPGLTADHRLFNKQIEYFENRINVFVWDPPAHAASWPFEFDFDLMDKLTNNFNKKENIVEIKLPQTNNQHELNIQRENGRTIGTIDFGSASIKIITDGTIRLVKDEPAKTKIKK